MVGRDHDRARLKRRVALQWALIAGSTLRYRREIHLMVFPSHSVINGVFHNTDDLKIT